ncbi:MAG: hypothetical protein ACK559_13520, partial [bacterium]
HRDEKRQDHAEEDQVQRGEAGLGIEPAFLPPDVASPGVDGDIAGGETEQHHPQEDQQDQRQGLAPGEANVAPGEREDAGEAHAAPPARATPVPRSAAGTSRVGVRISTR